jgi:DNA polymerase
MQRDAWQGESWKNVIRFMPWSIELPNGMALNYDPKEFSQDTTFGGKITENIVQALSRIVLSDHMLQINALYPVAFTVHDEITVNTNSNAPNEVLHEMIETFRTPPGWCEDIPLDAEGSYDRHYSK